MANRFPSKAEASIAVGGVALRVAKTEERFPSPVGGIVGGSSMERDGEVNLVAVTMAMAQGARNGGITFLEGVPLEPIPAERGKRVGAITDQGEIRADKVVICGGMCSRHTRGLARASPHLHVTGPLC